MIIELEKLRETPCRSWLRLFEDGKLNVYEAFEEYGQQYDWLYKYSDYDLIGWQVENKCFDWKGDSWLLAKYCPDKFDKHLYNWREYSWAVAEYCSQHLDKEKYKWEIWSWKVAKHCPEHFDSNLYNWEDHSWAVAIYCHRHFDPDLYNWKRNSWNVAKYCPHLLYLKPETV